MEKLIFYLVTRINACDLLWYQKASQLIIKNLSTTVHPEFCGIDHVGTAVEAFAMREWSGDLACLKSMAAFNFK